MHSNTQKESLFTAESVRRELLYDENTGELRWRNRGLGRQWYKRAGCLSKDGYRYLRLGGHLFFEHRLIWLIKTGAWPKFEIDHRDLNRSNNSWSNLREATSDQNHYNVGLRKDNKLQLKGASKRINRPGFRARIVISGKQVHLGNFATAEEAHAAYVEAAKKRHTVFWREK